MLEDILLIAANMGRHGVGEAAVIVICVLICGYLLAALLWPEKF